METVATISARDNGDTGGGSGGVGGECHFRRCRRENEDEVAAAAMRLKKILEWELSLDARDLRSHAWYHGAISRTKAEHIVADRDGDFLVRDCISQPGDYVLSCRSKGQNLHFVINKMVLQADTVYESVQYRFEDDGFDTVPDLITYYVGSGKPVTIASGAKIQNPRNRRHPLSFYSYNADGDGDKYVQRNLETRRQRQRQQATPNTVKPTSAAIASNAAASKSKSPTTRRRDSDTAVVSLISPQPTAQYTATRTKNNHHHHRRDANRTADRYSCSNSLPRLSCCTETTGSRSSWTEPTNANVILLGSGSGSGSGSSTYVNARVAADAGGRRGAEPPPKPSRPHPAVIACGDETSTPRPRPKAPDNNCRTYAASSNSDSGNGSDDSAQSCNVTVVAPDPDPDPDPDPANAAKITFGVVIKNPKYELNGGRDVEKAKNGNRTAAATRGSGDGDDNDTCYGVFRRSFRRAPPIASAFDLDAFHSLLLPTAENKPLDTCALQAVHMLLMDSGSRILANHLTRADLELTVGEFVRGGGGGVDRGSRRQQLRRDSDSGSGSGSGSHYDCVYGQGDDYDQSMCKTGIELSFLPQGRRHRCDLIERSECLRLLVAVTILTCATESERAELLNKWIQVAIDTKTALGNLYGFCGIMLGLCTPQVLRLKETWHILRQRYTDSAFNFEAKLRPTLKCMNESTNPLAPNTTIPHLLPAVLLYETNYACTAHISGECGGDSDDDCDEMCHVFAANSHLWDVCINQWEACSPDLGLGTLYSHLNATRQFHNLLPTFKRNAEIVLTDSKMDHLLSDMFRTEFHMKFLWGSRGANVNASERYSKFQQVLNVMSQKCETIDYDDDDDDDDDDDRDIGSLFLVS